jgi:hypothetical protein
VTAGGISLLSRSSLSAKPSASNVGVAHPVSHEA